MSTSSPEVLLLVRMLRYQGRVTEQELNDLMRVTGGESATAFCEQLRERELVEQSWIEWAIDAARRKARRYLSSTDEKTTHDRSFGEIAMSRGWIAVADLEDAILEQQRLRRVNLKFRIGEIMVRRGGLTADQVREILAEQGYRTLSCGSCQSVVNISKSSDQELSACPLCQGELEPTIFLESVRGDFVV